MNLFDGANRNVEKHSTGMNAKFNKYGKKVFNLPEKNEVVEEQVTSKIIQGPETQKPELSEGEKSYRETRIQNAINNNNKAAVLKDMRNNILDGVFENVMADIYYNALYLDDDFKEFNSSIITESVHKFLDEKGGYKYLVDGYNRTKSPLLKSIMDICEESAAEIADRKIKECNDKEKDLNDIKIFNMTNDEKNNLDYNKDSIGIDQISNKIKDKILDVVKDEKKREADHEELMEEIENQLSDDPEVKDEKTVTEALNKIFISNVNIEEGTLFNSLLRTNYKGVLESGYDALDLSKINNQEDVYNILNEISLENLLIDDNDNEYSDSIYNDEMKDVFNNFIDELDRATDIGINNVDAITEAFMSCEDKFFDLANNAITKHDLNDLKHDFRTIQKSINDFMVVEEGLIESAKKAGLTIKNGVLKVDEKFSILCYKGLVKLYKTPSALERDITDTKETIEFAENELKKRSEIDEGKCKKLLKNFGRFGVLCVPYLGPIVNMACDNLKFDLQLKNIVKYNKIYIKIAEKRLKEIKDGKKKSSVKESYEPYSEIDEILLNEIIEECADIIDEINNDLEILEEANKNVIVGYLKSGDKADDKKLDKEDKKKSNKKCPECGKSPCICDESSCTKEGSGCDKSSCVKEGKDCDKSSSNKKCPECGKSPCICNESSSNKKCPECGKSPCICSKSSCTKEGKDCDKSSCTKEGSNSNTKKIDTEFDKDKMDKNVVNEDCEFFDLDDELFDDVDIVEEAKVSKDAYRFTFRNIGRIMMNGIKGSSDINKTHKNLLKMVNTCKTVKEIEYVQRDLSAAKRIITNKVNSTKGEEKKQYQEHLNWLKTTYSKAISEKKKELKSKQKTVKESVDTILEECVNIIDNKLNLHDQSNLNMANEVCEKYMGSTVLIPIMNKKDAGLEGLDLPYKMKHVLESLTNIMNDMHNEYEVNTLKKAVETNKSNVSAILESFKAIPSTPAYKMNYFNTFNDLLDILDSNLNEMSEVFESVAINEFDDVTDDLNIYENDYEYKVITESINDIDKLATDEVECIDMDFILADTIAKYTLMETMYTLKLEDYKYNDIKKMTTNMLNKK